MSHLEENRMSSSGDMRHPPGPEVLGRGSVRGADQDQPRPRAIASTSISKDLLFKVFVGGLLAFLIYDKFTDKSTNQSPEPKAVRPDPAVVQMGQTYGRALLNAAAESLNMGASLPWSDPVEAKSINRKAFDEGIRTAMEPLAIEQARRFGAATAEPMDPSRQASVRAFWRDLAAGIREVAE